MSPEELYECMIQNSNKTVTQISVESAKMAENEINVFMGVEVEARRKYYEEHYNEEKDFLVGA